MDVKELLGLAAALLAVAGSVPYVRDIFKGATKPHVFTFLIWSIVTTLAFLGQWAAGGGPGAWTTGIMAVLSICVLILSFKYGTKDITRFDLLCLIGALGAIIPWWLTSDPTISIVLATFIDVLAFFPTIRKTFFAPTSETLISYVLNIPRHGLAILALTQLSVATYIYPAAGLLMNIVLVSVIIGRRRFL